MNKAKLFYFIFYAAMAALSPFLTLYYQSLGLSGTQIGLLAGLGPPHRQPHAHLGSATADPPPPALPPLSAWGESRARWSLRSSSVGPRGWPVSCRWC